jgi:hypothetical protein
VAPELIPAAEARAIVDICGQLEGLPLALELAAAWARVLSCEQIATELRQGTELLRAVDAAHPARHASFEVVFDQSWQLLTPVERDALACLSVFRGGFSVEAARAVAGASLPVLGALADKSPSAQGRRAASSCTHSCSISPPSAWARAKRAPRPRKAHAAFFPSPDGAAARRGGKRRSRGACSSWTRSSRIAASRCAGLSRTGRAACCRNPHPTLFYFCEHRGRFLVGLGLLDELLESPLIEKDRSCRPCCTRWHRTSSTVWTDMPRRTPCAARARPRAAHARTPTRQGPRPAGARQSICFRLGRFAEACDFFEKGRDRAEAGGNARKVASMEHNMALVAKAMGRQDEARRIFHRARPRLGALGDVAGEAGAAC